MLTAPEPKKDTVPRRRGLRNISAIFRRLSRSGSLVFYRKSPGRRWPLSPGGASRGTSRGPPGTGGTGSPPGSDPDFRRSEQHHESEKGHRHQNAVPRGHPPPGWWHSVPRVLWGHTRTGVPQPGGEQPAPLAGGGGSSFSGDNSKTFRSWRRDRKMRRAAFRRSRPPEAVSRPRGPSKNDTGFRPEEEPAYIGKLSRHPGAHVTENATSGERECMRTTGASSECSGLRGPILGPGDRRKAARDGERAPGAGSRGHVYRARGPMLLAPQV